MKIILGVPRFWWPQLRNANNKVSKVNILEILQFLFNLCLVRTRIRGARAAQTRDKRTFLILNKETFLGKRNDEIFIEKDNVIYRSILMYGQWGIEESRFLASLCNQEVTLIDLGANVGLISRQVLKMNNFVNKVIAVEPRSATMENLRLNLTKLSRSKEPEIILCKVALGRSDGKSILHTEVGNIGNSSLQKGLTPNSNSEEIDLVSSQTFYDNFLKSEKGYILKSDLQGMDATVLNLLPAEFWGRLIGAVIEIWPSDFVDRGDVLSLSKKIFEKFECSYNPDFSENTSYDKLVEYWLSSLGKSRNLYIRKLK